MAPENMKQWSVQGKEKGFDELTYKDAPVPTVGDNDVLVKFHAASLNYRDLVIPRVGQWLHKVTATVPIANTRAS
jgi:NADPH:quinone reductase-like Zn-dependent oxidoreductase